VTAADVYRALWRHKAFITIMTLAVVGAVWFLTSRQTAVYEAKTKVHIIPPLTESVNAEQAADIGERLAQTYAEAAQTAAIARLVYTELNGDIPLTDIQGKISATPARGLEFLTIAVRNENPERAQLIANAVAPAIKSYIGEFENLRNLEVSVVNEAVLPKDPASPNLPVNLALALLFGFLFNAALALLVEAVGDRIHDTDELERLTGQPVLATIPGLKFMGPPSSAAGPEPAEKQSVQPLEIRS
jgi:succinoglycan biosynthesis transport protein ExoP